VRYTESRDDGGTCRHGGLEDVVVVTQRYEEAFQRWLVLDLDDADWVYVMSVTVP
jgi:hypothetical protein